MSFKQRPNLYVCPHVQTLAPVMIYMLNGRLAIYYLNAVSKAYQQANVDLKKKMQMVSMSLLLCLVVFCSLFPSDLKITFSWMLEARDEEKNRRNNKDSTNQVKKDLDDLLPNKILIPPPTVQEELPPPGKHTLV